MKCLFKPCASLVAVCGESLVHHCIVNNLFNFIWPSPVGLIRSAHFSIRFV